MASVRLAPELEKKLRELATVKGVSVSELHRQALEAYVQRELKKGGRYSDVIGVATGDEDLSSRVSNAFTELLTRD